MNSVINNFQINNTGRNCLYSSIHNVLTYLGLPFTEAEAFLAFQGLNVRYDFESEYYGIKDIITQVEHNLINQTIILHKNGLINDDLEGMVCEYISRGIPVICIMQVNKLHYLNQHTENTSVKRHVCVLYGIDTTRDKAYIADAYIVDKLGNVSTYQGEISLREILKATIGYFAIEKGTETVVVNWKEIFIQAVSSYVNGYVNTEYAFGHKAFTEYMMNLKKYENEPTLYPSKCYDACYVIKVTSIQPNLMYLCDFIKQQEFYEKPEIKDLVTALEEVNIKLDVFRARLIRDCFRVKEKREAELLQTCIVIIDEKVKILNNIIDKVVNISDGKLI